MEAVPAPIRGGAAGTLGKVEERTNTDLPKARRAAERSALKKMTGTRHGVPPFRKKQRRERPGHALISWRTEEPKARGTWPCTAQEECIAQMMREFVAKNPKL